MSRLQPVVDLALRLVLGVAVALLQAAGELRALAFDHVQVVVGELAPLLPDLTFKLLPVAFDAIPVHCSLSGSEVIVAGPTRQPAAKFHAAPVSLVEDFPRCAS